MSAAVMVPRFHDMPVRTIVGLWWDDGGTMVGPSWTHDSRGHPATRRQNGSHCQAATRWVGCTARRRCARRWLPAPRADTDRPATTGGVSAGAVPPPAA